MEGQLLPPYPAASTEMPSNEKTGAGMLKELQPRLQDVSQLPTKLKAKYFTHCPLQGTTLISSAG